VTVRALLTPGHTRGSTTFVMEVDGRSVAFPNGTAINPGYRLAGQPSYPGIAEDYQRALRVLAALQPDIWLNAHTDSFDFEAKRERAKRKGVEAWVDPAGYRRWVLRHQSSYELALRREAP
jgi:metallo-beta-lactamase class B